MVVFRADGNPIVGLGHVMRCISIADAFKNAGECCLFVFAESGLENILLEHGHECIVLNSKYDEMEAELYKLGDIINHNDVNAVFLDSYYVTDEYLKSLLKLCSRRKAGLVYIDDMLAFPYPCDVVINYNIYADEDDYRALYRGVTAPSFLLNTSYAPQRVEFLGLPNRIVKRYAKDILISTGGADSEQLGLEMIKRIIVHEEWNEYTFHFIIGLMNTDKDMINRLSKGKKNIQLYENIKNISKLMQRCDVAISAAGSTLYELCSTQTPTVTYILADNQIPGARGFENKGVLHCVGDIRELGKKELAEATLKETISLTENYRSRCSIAKKMKTVVDGKGAERIVSEVMKRQICL